MLKRDRVMFCSKTTRFEMQLVCGRQSLSNKSQIFPIKAAKPYRSSREMDKISSRLFSTFFTKQNS